MSKVHIEIDLEVLPETAKSFFQRLSDCELDGDKLSSLLKTDLSTLHVYVKTATKNTFVEENLKHKKAASIGIIAILTADKPE